MGAVVFHLPPKPPEVILAWPEGPWKISDFAIGAIAPRAQIEHLIGFARVIARLRNFDERQTDTIVRWAEGFFRPLSAPVEMDWTVAHAVLEICYSHLGVYLHGHAFHVEYARMEAMRPPKAL